jgi:RNA polymerase sigma-70 factor, ECF subfamily
MNLDTNNTNHENYDKYTDLELIHLILAVDKNHYKSLLDRYQKPIFAYIFRLLNFNQQETEDCTAQTFINAYIKLTSYQPTKSFSSWLYRIAHNMAVDHIRKYSGKNLNFDPDLYNDIPRAVSSEFDDKLDFILNKLKLDEKNLLILFYVQGLSLIDLSDLFNLLPNTIAARIKRAKDKAKKLITQYYPETQNQPQK